MSNLLRIPIDNPDDILAVYGAGAKVRLETSTTGGGAGFSEVSTQTVVTGTTIYPFVHAGGATGDWYRHRFSIAAPAVAADYSAYSDEYQGGVLAAYADLDDFLAGFEGATPAASRTSRILDVLDQASEMLTAEIGWDFFRHPAVSGTEVRVFNSAGGSVLHVHSGIVSLSLVEIAQGSDLAYTSLAAADWYLEPLAPEPGEPYDHLHLAEGGAYSAFPTGQRRVRLTGAFGYAAVPGVLRTGTVALARQLYRADSTVPGGMAGPDEWATPGSVMPRGWPDAAYRAINRYRRKFFCHV